jgi:hypothetical protein
MARYRIIKTETIRGSGDTKTTYKIQKKFLFWFFDHGIKSHYYTYTDWGAIHKGIPTHMALITERIFIFNTEVKAREYLNKIKNPFKERYMGDLIVRAFDDDTWADVYINLSYYGRFNGDKGYEYSKSLDGLKEKIAHRKTKTKISTLP